MAKADPKYIRAFKALTRGDVTYADLPVLEAELYGANDRARAVMLSSIVESALEVFVRHRLRPSLSAGDNRLLFDFTGPLGTFSSKIVIAYAFNFFGPETRNDLELVRLTRNGFAHSRKSFDFTTPEVAAICAELKSPDWPGAFLPHSYLRSVAQEGLKEATDKSHPRTRWIMACHIVPDHLLRNTYSGGILAGMGVPDLR